MLVHVATVSSSVCTCASLSLQICGLDALNSLNNTVRRVGRTGRGGKKGTAITFLTAEDSKFKTAIEEILKSRRSNGGGRKQMLIKMPGRIALHMEALRVRAEDVVRYNELTVYAAIMAIDL